MSLDDYSKHVQDGEYPGCRSYEAFDGTGSACRLTVFSSDVSGNQDFRTAWRHDTELLFRLPHDGLPQLLETGDTDGVVYVVHEHSSSLTLDDYLASHSLTWDETADLGWQAASVIQHLHNSGIVHGGLDDGGLRITPQLRVLLVDTGVKRWLLAATEPQKASDVSRLFRADLVALGRMLKQLAEGGEEQTDSPDVPQQWWDLIEDLADESAEQFPTTAREVQGRLGGVLLEGPGESMDVVANRTGPGHSSRSIVDELLDVPISDAPIQPLSAPSDGRRIGTFAWILVGIVVGLICVVAGLVFMR